MGTGWGSRRKPRWFGPRGTVNELYMEGPGGFERLTIDSENEDPEDAFQVSLVSELQTKKTSSTHVPDTNRYDESSDFN